MGFSKRQGWVFLAVVTAVLGLSVWNLSAAQACSAPACEPDAYVTTVGTFPANLPGIVWYPGGNTWEENPARELVLVRTDGEADEVIAYTLLALGTGGFLIQPNEGFVAGATYEARPAAYEEGAGLDDETCRNNATFEFDGELPLPTLFASIVLGEETQTSIEAPDSSGGCTEATGAVERTVTLNFASEAEGWQDTMIYRTYVDGELWTPHYAMDSEAGYFGTETWPRGETRLNALCGEIKADGANGLSEGTHMVRVEGEIPGTSTVLTTGEVAFELHCEDTAMDDGGDADGGLDEDLTGDKKESGGCAVSAGQGSTGAPTTMMFLAVAAVIARRVTSKRRRS